MSDTDRPTELGVIIEYLHRRGIMGPNRVEGLKFDLSWELPVLAYDYQYDIDKMFRYHKWQDYGFDVESYLFFNAVEIHDSEDLQQVNRINDYIFHFPGDFTWREKNFGSKEEFLNQDDDLPSEYYNQLNRKFMDAGRGYLIKNKNTERTVASQQFQSTDPNVS